VLSVILTPLAVEAIQLIFGGDIHVNPLVVTKVVIESILLPLGIGLAIARWWPAARRWIPAIQKVSSVLLLVCAVILIASAWELMTSVVREWTTTAIIVVSLTWLAIGHLLGGPDEDDRTVLALRQCHATQASPWSSRASPISRWHRSACCSPSSSARWLLRRTSSGASGALRQGKHQGEVRPPARIECALHRAFRVDAGRGEIETHRFDQVRQAALSADGCAAQPCEEGGSGPRIRSSRRYESAKDSLHYPLKARLPLSHSASSGKRLANLGDCPPSENTGDVRKSGASHERRIDIAIEMTMPLDRIGKPSKCVLSKAVPHEKHARVGITGRQEG
jgi:hypothetical protein